MTNKTEAAYLEQAPSTSRRCRWLTPSKFVRSKGERVMYVFTDVDCPLHAPSKYHRTWTT